jgi:hypothetical protein
MIFFITDNKYFLSTTVLVNSLLSRCGKEIFINPVDKLEERTLRALKSAAANLSLEFRHKV